MEKKKVKLFISQPMLNRSNEEIKTEREMIIASLKTAMIYSEIEVIDSFFENVPHEAKPLWFLGKSLELLSTADLAVFAKGWESARGCKIEHECALQYGISLIYME